MEAMVYQKACTRCGLCVSLCPEVFSMAPGEAAQAQAGAISTGRQAAVQAAADACPVDAIQIR